MAMISVFFLLHVYQLLKVLKCFPYLMLLISKVVHQNKLVLLRIHLSFGIKQDNVGPDGMYQMTEKKIFTMASHVSSALVSTMLLSPLSQCQNPSILTFEVAI